MIISQRQTGRIMQSFEKRSPDYDGNIEELFRAELYLISPLREPERFYRKNISDGTAKRYRTTDPERNPCKTFRLLLVQRTSGDGKDVASV